MVPDSLQKFTIFIVDQREIIVYLDAACSSS